MAERARENDDEDGRIEPLAPKRSRLFRNGNSQALRVPATLAFEREGEVEIWREGDRLIVRAVQRGEGFRFSYEDPERVALGLRRSPPAVPDEAADDSDAWGADDARWTDEIFGDEFRDGSSKRKGR